MSAAMALLLTLNLAPVPADDLVGHLTTWAVEPAEGWTVEEARNASPGFLPGSDHMRFGYSPEVYWFRLDWEDARPNRWLAQWPAQMDHVDVWLFPQGQPMRGPYRIGDSDPRDPSVAPHRVGGIAFPDSGAGTALVRIQSTNSIWFEPRVFTNEGLTRADLWNFSVVGIAFGFLLLMLVTSLFVVAVAGDRLFLWYAAYLASMVGYLAVSSGAIQGMYPELKPFQNAWDVPSQAAFLAAAAAFSFRANAFSEWWPSWVIAAVLAGIGAVVLAVQILGHHQLAMVLVHALTVATMLLVITGVAIQSLRRRRMSRYFLVGWSAVIAVAAISLVGAFGLPGPWDDVLLNTNLQATAYLVESLVFALALADRLNTLQRQRTAYLEQSAQADRLATLGLLVAQVGHEVNNPNHVVSLNAAALENHLKRETDVDGARELVRSIRRASAQISQVVSQLRAGLGPQAPRVRLDLAELVRSTVAVYETAWRVHGRVLVRLPNRPVLIQGVEFRLQQLVVNLTTNGLNALEGRDRTVTLVVTDAPPGPSLSVVDEGTGMPPEVMARLGQPLFTTRGDKGGTGLGWALCQDIVRQHGARLTIDSAPGRGTSVTVRF